MKKLYYHLKELLIGKYVYTDKNIMIKITDIGITTLSIHSDLSKINSILLKKNDFDYQIKTLWIGGVDKNDVLHTFKVPYQKLFDLTIFENE